MDSATAGDKHTAPDHGAALSHVRRFAIEFMPTCEPYCTLFTIFDASFDAPVTGKNVFASEVPRKVRDAHLYSIDANTLTVLAMQVTA